MGMSSVATQVETPSGKSTASENFPVGSWLLPRELRPAVGVYYAFARSIDDIADSPNLQPAEKLARLEGFAAAVKGTTYDPAYAKGHALRTMFEQRRLPAHHGLDLISAFTQDVTKTRYASWAELIDYCDRSAAPVGRFLLDLHGEDPALYPLSDALCRALQVINHLQDASDDFAVLDRVYLPQDWISAEGAAASDLACTTLSPAMRKVFDRALAGTGELLETARELPRALRHRRLAAEAAVIATVADKLAHRLAHRDPLETRVTLGPVRFTSAALSGLARLWL